MAASVLKMYSNDDIITFGASLSQDRHSHTSGVGNRADNFWGHTDGRTDGQTDKKTPSGHLSI